MACVSPPELADMDLLAYLDDESDDRVVAHLERCPHCRERAQDLAHVQGQLTAHLYRFNCPSPAELGEYHLGLMHRDRAMAFTQHLAECLRCAQEVGQLKDFLAELGPELELNSLERAWERVEVLIARLVNGGVGINLVGQPARVPVYNGLRGDAREPLIYEADGVQVVVEIHEDPKQPDLRSILGLVIGVNEPHELEVHLWHAGQHLVTVPVGETGGFFITSLTAGSYELILAGPEVEIHIQELDVGNSIPHIDY